MSTRIDEAIDSGEAALNAEFQGERARDADSSARGEPALLDNKIDNQIAAIERIVDARTIAFVLTAFPTFDDEDGRAREELLVPFNDQQKRVAEARKRRREPTDVDPEAGDPVPEGDVPDREPTDGDEPADPAANGADQNDEEPIVADA